MFITESHNSPKHSQNPLTNTDVISETVASNRRWVTDPVNRVSSPVRPVDPVLKYGDSKWMQQFIAVRENQVKVFTVIIHCLNRV